MPKNYNEIDLTKFILFIWKDKWKIFIISFLMMAVMYFYQIAQPPFKASYVATTTIKPIKINDENKFELYNSYLKKFGEESDNSKKNQSTQLIKNQNPRKYFVSFKNINKEFLINLYINKLNEFNFHLDSIKKFGLVNKKDYLNDQDYENAVIINASEIEINPVKNELNNWDIRFITSDLEKWVKYLNFIEKKANQEIQLDLRKRLKILIENERKLRRYEIEDLEIKISNTIKNYDKINQEISNDRLDELKILKRSVMSKKDIERFEEIIIESPISNSENFFAAQMMIGATKFQKIGRDKFSMKKIVILTGILGIILGLIYVILLNTIILKIKK
jgi:LPS O-antigen subunit length determinant protein (WzzB/FepE family)